MSALLSLLGIGTCAAAALEAPKTKREAAERADAAAQRAKADDEEQAQRDAEDRKRCKIPDAVEIFHITNQALRDRCEAIIDQTLKVPRSGKYPTAHEDGDRFVSYDDCTKTLQTYVDAKNAFGVMIRTPYECSFDPRTGLVRAKTTE